MSRINEVDFGVTELIKRSAEGDEVFIELELTNDVVAGREDEGVGFVVITAEELIVAGPTIKGVGTDAAIEGVIAFASVELVVVFKTKDEVVLIGAIEVGAKRFISPGVR